MIGTFPVWHNRWDQWRGIFTGDTLDACNAKLRSLGLIEIDETTYALARNIQSEQGDGTTEEKVCLAESTINHARVINSTVLRLLQMPDGGYGSTCSGCGRFTSTARSPDVDDVFIAQFVMGGQSGNYARGADDQMGYEVWSKSAVMTSKVLADLSAASAKGFLWVGHIPGVDPWRLALYTSPSNANKAPYAVSALQAALEAGRTVWEAATGSAIDLLPMSTAKKFAIGAIVAAVIAGGAYYFFVARKRR